MSHYVGLDVSVKSVSICVVDTHGAVLTRGETASDPDRIVSFIREHTPDPERVVHESGILAIWLTRELERRGHCQRNFLSARNRVKLPKLVRKNHGISTVGKSSFVF